MNYSEALKKTMGEESKSDAYARMTTEALVEGVAAITTEMRGPMPNHERIFQSSIRRAMREELAKRDAPK